LQTASGRTDNRLQNSVTRSHRGDEADRKCANTMETRMTIISTNVATSTSMSGLRFAHNHLSLDDRARMVARMLDNKTPVVLTLKQAELVCGVPASRIAKHRQHRPKRKSFRLAKAIADANADEVAHAHGTLGTDAMFAKLFEPQLPL